MMKGDGFSCTRQRVRNSAKRRSSTAKSRALTTSCAFSRSFDNVFSKLKTVFWTNCKIHFLNWQIYFEKSCAFSRSFDLFLPLELPQSSDDCFLCLAGARDIKARDGQLAIWKSREWLLSSLQTYQMSTPGPQAWSSFLDPISKKPLKTLLHIFIGCRRSQQSVFSKNLAEEI